MRVIFHIDMDSYFATVEQLANPLLRGRPIAVGGKEGSRTVIVAASKEAKRFGVKTGQLYFEAKKLCPRIEFVFPDGDKYQFITDRLVEIFERFTDKVEIFSIDEAFLDMTGWTKNLDTAPAAALEIKENIKKEIGAWLTCSVGIANNKLLAKLASDLDKPDGIFVINEKNKFAILDSVKLDDFCGIGGRILARLDKLGITTVKKLRNYPVGNLISEFGPFCGNFLKRLSVGEDASSVVGEVDRDRIKSVSRSYTLPSDTGDKKEICQVLLNLCERCGRQLRRENLAGKTFEYYWRYDDFTHAGRRLTSRGYINDGLEIYRLGSAFMLRFRLRRAVRKVGVRVSNLVLDYKQLPLWIKDRKKQQLLPYLDKINDRYGDFTIKPAFLADEVKLRRKVGGFRFGAE